MRYFEHEDIPHDLACAFRAYRRLSPSSVSTPAFHSGNMVAAGRSVAREGRAADRKSLHNKAGAKARKRKSESILELRTHQFLGIYGAPRIPLFSVSSLEGQAAPQNSFISNESVVSIPPPLPT
jgi:hypothetical protein